jgi:O-antigen/teichoic acid export membrane protein
MTRYKSNLFANFAGTGYAALLQLAFIPIYVRFLGVEAYGLIGFYIMIQAVVQVLDLGLGPTMNREMARYSVLPDMAGEARDFARTLEAGYWALGVSAGAIIALSSSLIATRWINVGTLPLPVVRQALMLMGGLAALQLPLAFYQGGLMGLQRQVLLNGVKIAMATLGSGGAVMILWLVSPTITAFLGWQLAVGAVQALILAACLWNSLPSDGSAPRFAPALLRNVWRFAAGMSGITIATLILTQLDKVILSKLLPLKMFGYYTLATALGNGLYVLITPVFNATFPKLSALVASRDENGVRELYHLGTQVMAVLVLPVASVTAFFSYDIMALWTGSAETARYTAPIVSILIAGTAMNGLMNLPYALQLAHGWTKLGFLITVGLIFTMAPSMVAATLLFGPVGAAYVWSAVNFVYLMAGIPLTHRRVLVGEARRWYLHDIALPLAASVLLAGTAREVLDMDPSRRFLSAVTLSGVLLAVVSASAFVSPILRKWMRDQWRGWKGSYA